MVAKRCGDTLSLLPMQEEVLAKLQDGLGNLLRPLIDYGVAKPGAAADPREFLDFGV
jgi:hypothetical protein